MGGPKTGLQGAIAAAPCQRRPISAANRHRREEMTNEDSGRREKSHPSLLCPEPKDVPQTSATFQQAVEQVPCACRGGGGGAGRKPVG
ncbi:hypothetical protein AAFF_G00113700 [Aldrovandia affinis]|uniref:Uncharacterized protein n=1 Tax=Aldrovandia affinis TaxID=143900 RepID=A0AAD7RVR3_9TELE|nr:hypothetical protein AAFF_G00113700 [Aldrovandia affinis]